MRKFSENELSTIILDEDDNLVCITDPDTYDIVYLNKGAKRLFHLSMEEDCYKKRKCYALLQGLNQPCSFCTNKFLTTHDFYRWEFFNPVVQRYFMIKDKFIVLDNKTYRLEIAVDLTDKEEERKTLELELEKHRAVTDLMQKLDLRDMNSDIISEMLHNLGEMYDGDRCYIIDADYASRTFNNTYEWCNDGIHPEIQNIQGVPFEGMQRWLDEYEKNGELIIDSLHHEVAKDSFEYQFLKSQNIESIISVPLLDGNKIVGLIGVDNPKKFNKNLSFIKTIAQFYVNEMKKLKVLHKLQKLSIIDSLTHVFNRNEYINEVERFKQEPKTKVGTAFIDLNELKTVNDKLGHDFGDRLIIRTAEILNKVFPKAVYRIGGDEFVVVEKGVDEEDFNKQLKMLHHLLGLEKTLKLSIGSVWELAPENIEGLVTKADQAMYKEKHIYYASKNRIMR